MRKFLLAFIAPLLSLTACSNIKKPSDANYTKAINQYLAKHGEICTSIGHSFPIDIPDSQQNDLYGVGPELAVLEQAGLVDGSKTTTVVHGMLDALRGSSPAQRVKRYQLTQEGKKYFRQAPGVFGQIGSFCYGQKVVDSIVKWTEPMTIGAYSQTEVTYTYKIANLASWAERPDVQRVFPDIRMMVSGTSKASQIAGLQLTNQGWEVPGQ